MQRRTWYVALYLERGVLITFSFSNNYLLLSLMITTVEVWNLFPLSLIITTVEVWKLFPLSLMITTAEIWKPFPLSLMITTVEVWKVFPLSLNDNHSRNMKTICSLRQDNNRSYYLLTDLTTKMQNFSTCRIFWNISPQILVDLHWKTFLEGLTSLNIFQ